MTAVDHGATEGTPRGAVAAAPAALSLEDLDYELPQALVAQTPVEPRDASRLLVYRRELGTIEDRGFADLPDVLRSGDVLVRNDTRVFPARAFFRRQTGGRIEVLFLKALGDGTWPSAAGGERWEVLLRGRPRSGEELASEAAGTTWPVTCIERLGGGRWVVASAAADPVLTMLERVGVTPLPPYIGVQPSDPERYQTVYARVTGSAAAPTAGLHFTPALDARLAGAGVSVETVTLHVGLGTFKPLSAETLAIGRLHRETYEVEPAVWSRLLAARAQGRRIVAVGTTSMRTLEHLARVALDAPASYGQLPGDEVTPVLRGETDLLIAPGFEFRLVDGLITNFHLPRTSLMALVMAFCGVAETRRLYRHAVSERYRFYSFGDAMVAL